MGCYEWEAGTVTLPSKAVGVVKKAVREAASKFHADVRDEVASLYAKTQEPKPTRSVKTYEDRLHALYREPERYGWSYAASSYASTVRSTALEVIRHMVYRAEGSYGAVVAIHKPTVAEVSVLAQAVTNKTTTFTVVSTRGYVTASITFDGRAVQWRVEENKNVVEESRESPVGLAFFAALEKVEWTPRTGGVISGNNEYSREDESPGGGANYISLHWGPLGDDAVAYSMGLTPAKYRKMLADTKKAEASRLSRRYW